ncbi:phage tail tape measure protein [Deinococcus hopiensis]|nr:phage tail tape measure protein [Deinococcus hopiensis]
MRLTAAAGANLGMSQRLSGVFAFIPGPLGLFASAASTATVALNGLTTAQRLNTVGSFALVGGLAAIGVAAASLASHGIKQLNDFQAAVNTLNAQGEGLGNGLDARVRLLQSQGGRVAQQFNRAELGTGIADLTKQGLAEADAIKLVATSYKLAAAEGQSLTESSSLLLANLRQFGLDGPKAAAEAAHFGDVFAKGSLLAASGAKELQQGLSVVGPIAARAGFSIEETTANLVALDNTGLKASTIGANAFRAVLLALASPTGVASQEIKKLGVEMKNADGSARNVRDILIDLRKAAAVSGDSYDSATQATIRQADSVEAASKIFRSRGIVGFLNMRDSVEKYNNALKEGEGALNQYAKAMTEGAGKATERLRNAVDDLALTFAQQFSSKLGNTIDSIAKLVRQMDLLLNNRETFKAYATALVVGFGAITTAMILNGQAARLLLADSSFAGLVALYRASVAAQLFTKVAAGLRAVALASAIGFNTGGVIGFVGALNAIPVAAASALAGIALLAGGLAAYALKFSADTRAIVDQTEKVLEDQFEGMMARVKELRGQGKLGNLKANQLLTINLRYNFENSDERNKELDARLLGLKKEIQAETDAEAARLAASKSKRTDVAATAEQTEAYDGLLQKLDDLKTKFSESGTTTFQKNLQDARKSLADFNKEVDKLLEKGELTPLQGAALKKRAQTDQGAILQGITDRQLKEDGETRIKHERAVQDAQLALVKDGRQRRQVELQRQVDDVKKAYGEEIKTALQNAKSAPTPAARRQFQENAGELQRKQAEEVAAIQRKGNQDLVEIDQERLRSVRAAQQQVLEAQATGSAARIRLVEQERDRDLALAGENVQAKLAIEEHYGPVLAQMEQERIRVSGEAQRAALKQTLDQELKQAETAGNRRGELETAARQKYLTNLGNLELSQQAELGTALLAQDKRVQEERLTIYKESLAKRLEGLEDATGREIASLGRTLQAERAKALASGDGGKVAAIDSALETITKQASENARDFAHQLSDSSDRALELRDRLAGIDQTALGKARSSAASPFNEILKGANKEIADLQKSFAKLTPQQQLGDAGRQMQSRMNDLNGIVQDANARRNVAVLQADQAFYRKQQDDAEAAALKLAKTRFEAGKNVDTAGYQQALAVDHQYWNNRLFQTNEGLRRIDAALKKAKTPQERGQLEGQRTELEGQQDTIQQNLAGNDQERARVLELIKNRIKDARDYAREEAVSQLNLASTEKGRATARAHLLNIDQNRLAAIDQELATLRATGGTQEDILALEREQLTLRDNLKQYGDDDRQRAQQQVATQRSQLQTTLDLAKGDEARTRARADLLRFDQERLAVTDSELANAQANGATYERINELTERRAGLQESITRLEDDERAAVDALLASRLSLTGAELDYEQAIARSDAAVTRGLQDRLAYTAQEIADIDRRIGLAQENADGEAVINALMSERLQKQAQMEAQARDLARRPLDIAEQQLAVTESEVKLRDILAHRAGDALLSAQRNLEVTRDSIKSLQARINKEGEGALSDEERRQAQVKLNELLGQEQQERDAIVEAQFAQRAAQDDLLQSQVKLADALARVGDNAVVVAARNLSATQQSIALLRQRLAVEGDGQLVGDARTKAQTELNGLLTTEIEQRRALARAPLELAAEQLSLLESQVKLRDTLAGLDDNAVLSAQRQLQATRDEISLQQQRLAASGDAALSPEERVKAQEKLNGLLATEVQQRRAVAQAELDQAARQRSILDSEVKLATLLAGQDDGVTTARQDLEALERQLVAQRDLVANGERLGRTAEQRLQDQERLVQLETDEVAKVRAVGAALRGQADQARQLVDAQDRLSRARAGQDDAVSGARAELEGIQRQLVQARRNLLDSTLTPQQRVETERQIVDLQTSEVEGYRKIVDAQQESFRKDQQREVQARRLALTRSRLADDPVAIARLELLDTQQQLAFEREVERTASTVERQRAAADRISGLLQQEEDGVRKLGSAYVEAAQRSVDMIGARRKAELELAGLADDAVLSAQLELDVTTRQLGLDQDRLKRADELHLTLREREDLELRIEQTQARQVTQERSLLLAERERVRVLESLSDSTRNLRLESATPSDNPVTEATRRLEEATTIRARAQRTLQEAQADLLANPMDPKRIDALKAAQDGYTSAISGSRKAVEGLSSAYREQLGLITGVQEATQRLANSVQPTPEGQKPKIDTNLEIDRFQAIQERRNAAFQRLQAAMRTGDDKLITKALNDFNPLDERIRKQQALLKDAGISVSLDNELPIKDLLKQLERRGVQQEREATQLEQQAAIADQNSKTVDQFGQFSASFGESVQRLIESQQEAQATPPASPSPTPAAPSLPTPGPTTYTFDGQTFYTAEALEAYKREWYRRNNPQYYFNQDAIARAAIKPADVQQAVTALVQDVLSATVPRRDSGVPSGDINSVSNIRNVTYNDEVNIGPVTVVAAPGESPEQLYDKIQSVARTRKRRTGDC